MLVRCDSVLLMVGSRCVLVGVRLMLLSFVLCLSSLVFSDFLSEWIWWLIVLVDMFSLVVVCVNLLRWMVVLKVCSVLRGGRCDMWGIVVDLIFVEKLFFVVCGLCG